jgi:pimeloyl-ACP methyl ester carboxylesterase
VVTGGDGPPLLLVHGWPQTWHVWRLVMPALARDFQVIAVDQRGTGLSDGHYCLEEAPEEMLAALSEFLASVPGGTGRGAHNPRPQAATSLR